MRLFPRRNRDGINEPIRALIALEGSQIGTDGTGRIRHSVVIEQMPEIRHIIERKIPPRPTVIQVVIRMPNGREYITNPINANLRHTIPVSFPLEVITGRNSDLGSYCELRLKLHYNPEIR